MWDPDTKMLPIGINHMDEMKTSTIVHRTPSGPSRNF
jgi:hypothetical protein